MSYTFEYKMHLGQDCFMQRNCGYIFEVTRDDTLRYSRDTGRLELVSTSVLTAEDRTELHRILTEGGFFDLDDVLPDARASRGGQSLRIKYSMGSDDSSHAVTAFPDATEYNMPDGFLSLDESLRSFLFSQAGIKMSGTLEKPDKIF